MDSAATAVARVVAMVTAEAVHAVAADAVAEVATAADPAPTKAERDRGAERRPFFFTE